LDAGGRLSTQKSFRDRFRLVKASCPALSWRQWHGNDHEYFRQLHATYGLAQKSPEQWRGRLHLLVLKDMDQVAQYAFIGAISDGQVEFRCNAAAQPAQWNGFIFKMLAEKPFPAAVAQLAIERSYLLQTWFANGKIRDLGQRRLADTAIGGKQDREQAFSRGLESPLSPA
jgi:hypothetical protein